MTQPSPLVPAKLREMLKDYPKYVDQLQKALSSVGNERRGYAPPFEAAVWLLEDHLSSFISEARTEMHDAEVSGDLHAIERAKEKEQLMLLARSSNIGLADLSELRAFFDTNVA